MNTALVNHKVPVALICTDQFAKLKARVEKQTGWTSEQFEHRVKRYKKLSSTPTKEDLEAVAAKLLAMKWNSSEQHWTSPDPRRIPISSKSLLAMRLLARCAYRQWPTPLKKLATKHASMDVRTISRPTSAQRFLITRSLPMKRCNRLSKLLRGDVSGKPMSIRIRGSFHICKAVARPLQSRCSLD